MSPQVNDERVDGKDSTWKPSIYFSEWDDPKRIRDVSRDVHTALIPRRIPPVEGIDIATLFIPGKRCGGDLFDIHPVSDDVLAFSIFDVAGCGTTSALISALAKVSFLKHVNSFSSPRSVLQKVNEDFLDNLSADMFMTAFMAYLDLHNNKVTYCNAGHTPPCVVKSDTNDIIALTTSGLFVGMFENGMYEDKELYLHPRDWMFLFSNGLLSAYEHSNELLGRKKFEADIHILIESHQPAKVLESVRHTIDNAYDDNGVPDDDICAVAVQVLTQSRRNQLKVKLGFDMNDPVYIQYLSYFEEMDKVSASILGNMDNFGYPDDAIRKMKIALTELLANAIYHGNNKDYRKKVTVGHTINRSKIVISIQDEGEGFDFSDIPDPTLPENLLKDCGRGLFIVGNYVDELVFNERGNRVMIVKNHTIE